MEAILDLALQFLRLRLRIVDANFNQTGLTGMGQQTGDF
jgi:hypothetical protein